jgi:hypothetical protein
MEFLVTAQTFGARNGVIEDGFELNGAAVKVRPPAGAPYCLAMKESLRRRWNWQRRGVFLHEFHELTRISKPVRAGIVVENWNQKIPGSGSSVITGEWLEYHGKNQ